MAEPDPFLILIEIPVSRCVFGATISLEKKTWKLGNSETWKLGDLETEITQLDQIG